MIISNTDMRNTEWGREIFQGEVRSDLAYTWKTNMPPSLGDLVNLANADPAGVVVGADSATLARLQAAGSDMRLGDKEVFTLLWGGVTDTGLFDLADATKQMLGKMTQTVGILSENLRGMGPIYSQETSSLLRVLDVVGGVVAADVFTKVINGLTKIPIVGWIIRIVIGLCKIVTNLVKASRDAKLSVVQKEFARKFSVPVTATEYSPMRDQEHVKYLFRLMDNNDTQRIAAPAYQLLQGGEYLGFDAKGVMEDGSLGTENIGSSASGWIVAGQATGGFGLVPGTGNVARSLFFPTGLRTGLGDKINLDPGAVRDMGSLYPTSSGLASTWWSMVLSPGPAMFSVDPVKLMSPWEDYVYGMLRLAQEIRAGWTSAPAGIPWTSTFYCLDGHFRGNDPRKGVGNCTKKRRGDVLSIPEGPGRRGASRDLLAHLYNLYFRVGSWKNVWYEGNKRNSNYGALREYSCTGLGGVCSGLPTKNNPKLYDALARGKDNKQFWLPEPGDVDTSQSVPVQALWNLRGRQAATLSSNMCMYVSGDTDNDNRQRFSAFQDKELRDKWYESVTAIFQSGGWKNIRYQDMPEGSAKRELLGLAQASGLDPHELNPPCLPGAPMSECGMASMKFSAPSVLGDPKLPEPPATSEVLHKTNFSLLPGKRNKPPAGGAGAMVVGTVAMAAIALLMNKK